MGRRTRVIVGGLGCLWVVLSAISAGAASKAGFPPLQGHQILRYQPPRALDEIDSVYLYGALSLLEAHPRASPRSAPVLEVSVYPNDVIIPLFQHPLYHDIEVYLQAQFIDYTVRGLMENEMFDAIDNILYESEWEDFLKAVKAAQLSYQRQLTDGGLTRATKDASVDIFNRYSGTQPNPEVAGLRSLSPNQQPALTSSLSRRRRLYDLEKDEQIDIQLRAQLEKKSIHLNRLSLERERLAKSDDDDLLVSHERSGIVIRFLSALSKMLKQWYDNKFQALALGIIAIGCYLVWQVILQQKYSNNS